MVLFAFLLFTANKSNLSVRFLGESTARQSAFWFYPTFRAVETTYLGQKYKFTFSMHCPSSPFRNPGLHLQVKPTGEETLGAKRHNWSHFVFSQGLFAWGCSAIWLASTDRGWETRCDTTVSFLPLYFLKREKKQMSSGTAFKHARNMYFYFRKLIQKKKDRNSTLLFCYWHPY